eukprot:12929910-Prorocentrum_lima.AAC.1
MPWADGCWWLWESHSEKAEEQQYDAEGEWFEEEEEQWQYDAEGGAWEEEEEQHQYKPEGE